MPVFPIARPIIVPKATYDLTGAFVPFSDPAIRGEVVGFSLQVYSGTAMVYLYGDPAGKGLELASGSSFSFGMNCRGIWIKGVGGSTEVACVASVGGDI